MELARFVLKEEIAKIRLLSDEELQLMNEAKNLLATDYENDDDQRRRRRLSEVREIVLELIERINETN